MCGQRERKGILIEFFLLEKFVKNLTNLFRATVEID